MTAKKIMEGLNLEKMTYCNVPLSVIYKQIIRFMKENGIYTIYMESASKEVINYENFLKNIRSYRGSSIKNFFLNIYNFGGERENYNVFLRKLKTSKCSMSDTLYNIHFGLIEYLDNIYDSWK